METLSFEEIINSFKNEKRNIEEFKQKIEHEFIQVCNDLSINIVPEKLVKEVKEKIFNDFDER